jgi:hypothetical protein
VEPRCFKVVSVGALPVLGTSEMGHALVLRGALGALVLIVGHLRAFVLVDDLGTMMLLGFRCLWGLVLMNLFYIGVCL